jgi:O-antigen ligase
MTALLLIPFVIHSGTPKKVRLAALAGLVPVLICLYATVTRGAYLAAAAGILFIAIVRQKRLILPLLAVIILLVVFAPPYVESRLHSIVDLQHPENASRILLWGTGLRIFADHPIIGVGDIDLYELFVQYAPPGSVITWGHLHNVLLQILVNLGVVGFVVVVSLFVKIVMTEWEIFRRVRTEWFAGSVSLGALAVFVGFQVNGLTEWSFGDQEVVILLWVSLGLALAVGRLSATPHPES